MAHLRDYHVRHGRADLPYAIREHPGSDRLCVFFPKFRPGLRPPTAHFARALGVDSHCLFLGADEHTYYGPRREGAGIHTAVELVEEVSGQFGVDRAHVTFLGTSMGGACGMFVGLPHGGRVITGAPPILMGQLLVDWGARYKVGPKGQAARMLELGRRSDDEDVPAILDDFMFQQAREAQHPVHVHLYTSEADHAYAGNVKFAERFADHPLVDVSLTVADYGEHGNVANDFWSYARGIVTGESATAAS